MAAHSQSMVPAKKKIKHMDVDEFFNADFDGESDSSSISSESEKFKISRDRTLAKPNKQVLKKKSNTLGKMDTAKRSKTLASTIKDNDIEFYKFLQKEDKDLILNCEDTLESDFDSDIDEENLNDTDLKKKKVKDDIEKAIINMSSGDESDSDEEEGVHKLPKKLEVASDESTDEEEEDHSHFTKESSEGILLTHKLINKWTSDLQTNPTLAVFKEVVSAFSSAVQEAGGSEAALSSKYKVEGGTIFNSVVRLCLTQVIPALQKMLNLPAMSELQNLPDKSQKWKKLKLWVKSYLSSLLVLMSQMSEAAMINAVLKHVHKLIILFSSFPKLTKLLLKKLIKMWTTGEETTSVLAFLCINKIVHLKQDILLESCLKQMYLAYVSNCKFTSPTILPHINFMQKSLVEIFTIDHIIGYQYAFVYIRQLAIHLRNAITVKKKNTCQAVYNWQYIHCLGLWVQLLTKIHPSEVFQPLIYPLTQIIIGTIKLFPTARFYPLRFHCVQYLNKLASKTNTFIPTLPFLLQVFEQIDFNKKHKTISLKPFNFAVILKFSKSQLNEKAFKDDLIDQLYEHLLETFNGYAHSISFPEYIVPAVVQLKLFLKNCKIANYCKQIKQIVDKIQEQAKFITDKRRHANIRLDDQKTVDHWENQLAESDTPLRKFYTSWRKLRDRELQHAVANKDAISGAAIEIPTIDRKARPKKAITDKEDLSKLFEDDSDSDNETRFMLKEERPASGSKKRKHESDSDDYSDFDDDELEQLAQSGSSGESDSEVSDIEDDFLSSEENVNDSTPINNNKKKQNIIVKKDSVQKVKNVSPADEDDIVEEFTLSDFEESE